MYFSDVEGEALEAMNVIPFELHPAVKDSEGVALEPSEMDDQCHQESLSRSYDVYTNSLSISHRHPAKRIADFLSGARKR